MSTKDTQVAKRKWLVEVSNAGEAWVKVASFNHDNILLTDVLKYISGVKEKSFSKVRIRKITYTEEGYNIE